LVNRSLSSASDGDSSVGGGNSFVVIGRKSKRLRQDSDDGSDSDSSETDGTFDHRNWLKMNPLPQSSICGTQLDSFLLQHLDETYNITTMDQNIRFIVDNRASASAGGGVCSTADEEPSLIGGKRIREPNATNTSKQTICTQWLKQSFLPDCRICWHSVLQ